MIRVAFFLALLLVGQISAWPMTDPLGDVTFADNETPATGSGVDLLSLSIEETLDTLEFTLKTEPWRAVGVPGLDGVGVTLPFDFGEVSYAIKVSLYDSAVLDSRTIAARLFADVDPDGNGRPVGNLPIEGETDHVQFSLAKNRIRDQNGAPLVAGRSLDGLQVQSSQSGFTEINGESPPHFSDKMPDGDPMDFELTIGPAQSDKLQMVAPEPIRWSNGGSDIFAYEVRLINPENATIAFEAERVPEGWHVSVPDPTQLTQTIVTVYVQTPDRHIHAGDQLFELVAKADVQSRIELGVHYPEIPMPAGHHSKLFFHAVGGPTPGGAGDAIGTPAGTLNMNLGDVVMNTIKEYEPATSRPTPARHGFGDGSDDNFWGWPILLEPTLRTGLNFTGESSEIIVETEAPPVEQTGTLVGELLYHDREGAFSKYPAYLEGRIIADFSVPLTLGDTAVAEWQNWDLPDMSYQGPTPFGLNLKFYPDDTPYLAPVYSDLTPVLLGGEMTLPLGEFHEGVTLPLTAAQEAEAETLGDEEPEVKETPFLPVAIVALLVSCLRRLRN
jgi:hypothetical protein